MISTQLVDSQPSIARIETLNGRLCEWESLEKEKRIKSLEIVRTYEIPLEHGFIINDEYLFLWYYKWNFKKDKFYQEKHLLNNRKFYLITKTEDSDYFDYFGYRIHIKENTTKKNFFS